MTYARRTRYVRGKRVRALRDAMHMTQEELSVRSGISQSHLSEIENDKRRGVGSGVLFALARALRTNMAYLAGTGSDPRPRSKAKLGDLELDEAELLTNYRELKTKYGRAMARQVLEGLVRAERESPGAD